MFKLLHECLLWAKSCPGYMGQNLVLILKCSIRIVYTTIVYNCLHENNIVYVKY